jgi:hypothetical protein
LALWAVWLVQHWPREEVLLPPGVVTSVKARDTGAVGLAVTPQVVREVGLMEAKNLCSFPVRMRVETADGRVLYRSRVVPEGWTVRFRVKVPAGADAIYVFPEPQDRAGFRVGFRFKVKVT